MDKESAIEIGTSGKPVKQRCKRYHVSLTDGAVAGLMRLGHRLGQPKLSSSLNALGKNALNEPLAVGDRVEDLSGKELGVIAWIDNEEINALVNTRDRVSRSSQGKLIEVKLEQLRYSTNIEG